MMEPLQLVCANEDPLEQQQKENINLMRFTFLYASIKLYSMSIKLSIRRGKSEEEDVCLEMKILHFDSIAL